MNTKRKKVLVDFGLQFRYIGLAVIVSLISVFAGWYSCWTIMQEKLLPAFGISIIEATRKTAYKNLYISVAILLPLVATLFLFFTHRLAGAIFKIKKALSEIENGNIQKIELYDDDDLKNIAEGINNITEKLK
ncbi:MAG TPA: hypothetical protein DCX95_00435 [Elusimicrobia bacterium]|nr:hypothetical protein [Elusimicrobiota bacterium]